MDIVEGWRLDFCKHIDLWSCVSQALWNVSLQNMSQWLLQNIMNFLLHYGKNIHVLILDLIQKQVVCDDPLKLLRDKSTKRVQHDSRD